MIYYYHYFILCDPLYTVKLKGWGGNEKRSSDLATYLRSPWLWRRSSMKTLHAFFYKYCLHIVILLSYKFAPQWHLYMLSLYYCHDAFPCPGRVAMWENGKKYFEKTDIADLPATYKRNRKEIDIVSAGLVRRIRMMLLIIRSMFFMRWPSNVHIYIGARIRQGQHPWCQSMARYNIINQHQNNEN